MYKLKTYKPGIEEPKHTKTYKTYKEARDFCMFLNLTSFVDNGELYIGRDSESGEVSIAYNTNV